MLQVVGHSTPSFKLNYYYSFYFNTVRRGLLKSVGGCMHSHSIDLCHRSHYDTLIKVQYMKYKYMPSTHAWYSRTTHAYIMVCQINFIIVVGLDSLRGFFEYIQHIFKINTIFLWFVCVCVGGGGGGGGILVKWEKNAKYLDFSEDCMFGLALASTYFQFVTNWNFPFFINVIMKL